MQVECRKVGEGKGLMEKERDFFARANGDSSASSPPCHPPQPLMRQGAPGNPGGGRKRWQKSEDERRERQAAQSDANGVGIGFWTAICGVGLWMDERRGCFSLVLRRRLEPRKSGGQEDEGKPQRVKICDFASRGAFSKEGEAELFCGKRRGNGMAQYFAAKRN